MNEAPSEKPVCKDTAWARNLAASMKEGHGRHNSNLQFRDVVYPGNRERQRAAAESALRRVGQVIIKEKPELCAIGECCSLMDCQAMPMEESYLRIPVKIPSVIYYGDSGQVIASSMRTFLFEKVRLENEIGYLGFAWKRVE